MRDANKLVAGIDYPRTLQKFDNFFPNEDACRKYSCSFVGPKTVNAPDVTQVSRLGYSQRVPAFI